MSLETQNDHLLQSKHFYINFTTKIALRHDSVESYVSKCDPVGIAC